MISPTLQPAERSPSPVLQKTIFSAPSRRISRHLSWLCLLLACIGTSWFAFQLFLVPQPHDFAPDWQNARWVQAVNSTAPVAYFRYDSTLSILPDNAYITVTASQVFRLYVNGTYIGSNTMDFIRGNTPQTYMYDIASTLHKGANAIGLRISNADDSLPLMRANIGLTWGRTTRFIGTDTTWHATADTTQAHLRNDQTVYDWSKKNFDDSAWPAAQLVAQPPRSPLLNVNPQIYEQPLPSHWLSVGSEQESYYVRHLGLPEHFETALLRIVATGEADIFINNHFYIRWNGLVNVPQTNVVNYLTTNGQPAPYRNGLMLGVYDISPYLHAGTNTLAIHILAPGTAATRLGLNGQRSAFSIDMLVSSGGSYSNPLTSDIGWHASSRSVPGWTQEDGASFGWQAPSPIGRPGISRRFYLPDSNTPRNVQVIPPVHLTETVLFSIVAVLSFWLVLALLMLKRFYPSRAQACAAASLVFLPALALEALLIALARESQIPQPFPYSPFWGYTLLTCVFLSAILLWRHARFSPSGDANAAQLQFSATEEYNEDQPTQPRRAIRVTPHTRTYPRTLRQRLLFWLKQHWAILPVFLVSLPMVLYNPGYEPYWQDELSSYYAALHIMGHGYPAFPSGYTYPKAELFSYVLALVMSLFGTHSEVVTRSISMALFLISLPVFYIVACKFFNRRVAWVATAMLAFSPSAMVWSRQTRMYEMAQFMVIIVFVMLYWAIRNRDRKWPIFAAVGCLVLAYFSHEEVFIILPAVVFYALLGSREARYGIPAILHKKHWWIAALLGGAFIALQLTIANVTHPVALGTDQSLRPQIQMTTDNIPFYFSLLFQEKAVKDTPTVWTAVPPLLVVNSLLALLGCVAAFCRKNRRARYGAIFLLLSTCTLVFLFTMQAERYYYPLLPLYYLMGAYGLWYVLHTLWLFARPYLALSRSARKEQNVLGKQNLLRRMLHGHFLLSPPLRILLAATAALTIASILLVPMLPLSNFNLFVSRVTGSSYRHHYADYDNVGDYMRTHMRQGDIVISVAPAVSVLYYVGQVDNFFSFDRALFLFEKNGQLVETTSGSHPLLNQQDFQAVLAAHSRIWLVTDSGGYQGGVTKNGRFIFPPPDFRLVYEGYGSGIYFRGPEH